MVLSFACTTAASQRLDWLELRPECRTQVDRKDLCFEQIELSWICGEAGLWLAGPPTEHGEGILICM